MEGHTEELLKISEETLEVMNKISNEAEDELKDTTEYSDLEQIHKLRIEKRKALKVTKDKPIYASILVKKDFKEIETFYFTFGEIPNSTVYLGHIASRRAPLADLLSQDLGDFYTVKNHEYEIIRKCEFEIFSKKNNFGNLDSSAIINLDKSYSRKLKSLVDFICNKDNVQQDTHISGKIKKSIISNMSLRNKPILDKIQNEIYRYSPNTALVLLGAPGTGKTTTLVKKLGLNLDNEFSDLQPDARSWYMFTPTKLLHEYLKEAFNREDVAASDEHLMVWKDFVKRISREKLNILGDSLHKGFILVPDFKKAGIKDVIFDNQKKWYNAFKVWQDNLFISDIHNSITKLRELNDEEILRFLARGEFDLKNKSIDLITTIDKLVGNINNFIVEAKNITDKSRVEAFNLVKDLDDEEKNNLLNKLNDIYKDKSVEVDENEDNEGIIDLENARNIIDALSASIRSLSVKYYKKQNISVSSSLYKVSEIINFNNSVSNDIKEEIGKNYVKLNLLRKLKNIKQAYFTQLSNRYKKFKNENTQWYESEKNTNKISEIELDALFLIHIEVDQWLKLGKLDGIRRHQIFVDEITDFSSLQISAMYKLLVPNSKTFFGTGDFNQRLTLNGLKDEDDLKWAIPYVNIKRVEVPYRQTRQLSELSAKIIHSDEILKLPDNIDTEGVNPVMGLGLNTVDNKADWISERIIEIEKQVKTMSEEADLPSIAILVNDKNDIEPLVDALNERLQDINIDVEACYENARGSNNHVRVFCLDYIKGLEFEAAFFVDIDKTINNMPTIYDKFLYVGVSRAATFLGLLSTENSFPDKLKHIESYFIKDWK